MSADGKTWWLLTRLDAAQIAEALSKPAAPLLPPTPPVKTVQLDEPRVTAPPLPTDQPGELKINPTAPAPEPAAPERAPEGEMGVIPAPPEPMQEPDPQLEVTPAPGLSEPTQDLEPEPAAKASPGPLPTSVSEPAPVSTASSEMEPSAEVSAVAPPQTDIDSEVTQLHGQPVPSSADGLPAPVPAKLEPESTPAHASEPMQEPMPAPAASVDGPVLVDGPLRAEASARDSVKALEEDAEDLATVAAAEAVAAAAEAERTAAAETVAAERAVAAAEKAAAAAKERELRERENAAAPMTDSWNSPSKSPTPLMRAQALAAAPPVHKYDPHAPMGIPEKIAVVTPHKALKIFEVGLRALNPRRMSMQEKLALPVRAGYVPAESEDNGEGGGDEVGAGAGDGSLGGRLQRAQTSPARFTTTPSKNAQQLQFDAGVDRPHAQSQPDKSVMDARDAGEDDDDTEKSNANLASAGSADDAAATTGAAAEDTKIKRNPAMLARFAVKIQSYFRGHQARRHLEVKQKAAKTIQVHYGRYKWKQARKIQKELSAAQIQAAYRGHVVRKQLRGQAAAATRIQRVFRRYSLSKTREFPGCGRWLVEETEVRGSAPFFRGPILRPKSGITRQRPLLPIGERANQVLAGRNPALFLRLEAEAMPDATSFDAVMMSSDASDIADDASMSGGGSLGVSDGQQSPPPAMQRASSASPDRLSRSRARANRSLSPASSSPSRRRPPASAPAGGRRRRSTAASAPPSPSGRRGTATKRRASTHPRSVEPPQLLLAGWTMEAAATLRTRPRSSGGGGGGGGGGNGTRRYRTSNESTRTEYEYSALYTSTVDSSFTTARVDLRRPASSSSSSSALPGLALWPPPKSVSSLPTPDEDSLAGTNPFWNPTTGSTAFGRRWK